MEQADVVVVGAGPGGSSAAYFLARAGARVILLDKETFPRDKTCGDCVSGSALKQLDRMGLNGWIETEGFHAPSGVRIGAPNGELAVLEIASRSNQTFRFGRTIPRRKLDTALLGVATAAGAQFMAGARATGTSVEDGSANVYVVANGKTQTLRCQIVIAADGTKGSFSHSVGLQEGPLVGVAVRAYLAGDDHCENFFDMFYEADIVPGYGWVFPVGHGVCNVGIGMTVMQANGNSLKGQLQEFISTNPHVLDRLPNHKVVEGPHGASLYWSFRPKRAYRDRLLAVGDAVGLINPLTGSGISKALISGEIAAQCAHDAVASGDCSADSLAIYGRKLWSRFGKRHVQLKIVQRLFRHRRILNRLVYLLNHEASANQVASNILRSKMDYMALLKPSVLIRLLV